MFLKKLTILLGTIAFLLIFLGVKSAFALRSSDVNGDGRVNALDVKLILLSWLSPSGGNTDIDENSKTNSLDVGYVFKDFGQSLPTPTASPPSVGEDEWTQHAHDVQHTSYTNQAVETPWKWKWAWNGPDASGQIVSGKFSLPRNVQPVTGGGRVYVAAGSKGVYALSESNGAVAWNKNPGGNINSTVAFDYSTNAVFVVSSNGNLYKLDASTGNTLSYFSSTSGASSLPLPPAIYSDRVFFSMGTAVYAVNKTTMQQIWKYDAGIRVDTPPAYSPLKNKVIVATQDLYALGLNNSNGSLVWKTKLTPRNYQCVNSSSCPDDPCNVTTSSGGQVFNGWPAIAEQHGLVLIKLRLEWDAIWTWNPWPPDNATIRSNLQARPEYQALKVLKIDDGTIPFIANIGHGGQGNGCWEPMGPQPIIKRFTSGPYAGQEVVYTVIRGALASDSLDARWDSSFGEMVLDDNTIPGFQAGYVRWIAHTSFNNMPTVITDEQPFVTMAGDYLFAGHWCFGSSLKITDRSSSRGTYSNKILSINTPVISESDTHRPYNSGHYNSDYVACENGARVFNTAGFYIYHTTSYDFWDNFWSNYADWVVSNGNLYYRSIDGAIVALEHGNPGSP